MDYARLISLLENPPIVPYPVILPDFFVDHFVILPSYTGFLKSLDILAKQGGGNLTGTEQFIRRGGNCVNTTSALHALGVDAQMIITTDEYGALLLKVLASPNIDMNHVHRDGRLSTTVSIETEFEGRRINMMISDSGSAAAFGFDDLTLADLELIRKSGLVALVNLNHNHKGAQLAHDLFEMAKETQTTITFMDIGDPSSNSELLTPLVKDVLHEGLVDILGANENEICWLAWELKGKNERWRHHVSNPKEWIHVAKMVSHELGITIDLHTQHFSAIVDDDNVISTPSFQRESKVVCGAGDAWNAGDIYGHLLNLPPLDRIILANAVAILYVSSPTATHPSRQDILTFLRSNPALSIDGKKLLMHQ
ncbi:MAG: carbohydrate kinase family protein [Candidatus Thorarchaeota archaeon]|nr:carbohydrate kinase family protein [Candidatus Thorarchaeota archaeon]